MQISGISDIEQELISIQIHHPIIGGETSTDEGTSVACDKNGQLLFYTDGVTVWNKNHQLMKNGTGLFGDFYAAQSAVIIPDLKR
jgi:hypothetical protein